MSCDFLWQVYRGGERVSHYKDESAEVQGRAADIPNSVLRVSGNWTERERERGGREKERGGEGEREGERGREGGGE